MISFIWESKENDIKNLFMKRKQTHRLTREQTCGYQREGQVVRDTLGAWDMWWRTQWHVHIAVYKMDN